MPEMSARTKKGTEDKVNPPNTAHAVLCEGSLECLALSKRGLFAAGMVSCVSSVYKEVYIHFICM